MKPDEHAPSVSDSPADAMRDALAELVACEDAAEVIEQKARANDDELYAWDKLRELDGRYKAAWAAARALLSSPRPAERQEAEDTTHLMIDACVALESFLVPDWADERCDPKAVNARLLAWLEAHTGENRALSATPSTGDAERYRWVRDNIEWLTSDEDGIAGCAFSSQIPLSIIEKSSSAELLDAIADAAIDSAAKG